MANKKQWRFYRSNLSSIVWDRKHDRILADFTQGHFTTDDEYVANVLKALRYPEIDIDLETPPEIIVNQPSVAIEGDVPIMRPSMNEVQLEKRIALKTKEESFGTTPKVKEEVKTEKALDSAVKKTKSVRGLPRRSRKSKE